MVKYKYKKVFEKNFEANQDFYYKSNYRVHSVYVVGLGVYYLLEKVVEEEK